MSQLATASETPLEDELKQGRARRSAIPHAEIREAEKILAAFTERMEALIKNEAERLSRQLSAAIEASRRREAGVKADFEKLRSDLNTLTNGMAEILVRKCGDEEMLARFRRCGWRV